MPDLAATIESEAALPITSASDGQSSTGRTIDELIKADQYLAAKTARASRRRGILFTQLTTPGALDDCGRASGPPFAGGLG